MPISLCFIYDENFKTVYNKKLRLSFFFILIRNRRETAKIWLLNNTTPNILVNRYIYKKTVHVCTGKTLNQNVFWCWTQSYYSAFFCWIYVKLIFSSPMWWRMKNKKKHLKCLTTHKAAAPNIPSNADAAAPYMPSQVIAPYIPSISQHKYNTRLLPYKMRVLLPPKTIHASVSNLIDPIIQAK